MCDRDILRASMNRIDQTYIYIYLCIYIKEERGWLELENINNCR